MAVTFGSVLHHAVLPPRPGPRPHSFLHSLVEVMTIPGHRRVSPYIIKSHAKPIFQENPLKHAEPCSKIYKQA
jgi:hypothetical protein